MASITIVPSVKSGSVSVIASATRASRPKRTRPLPVSTGSDDEELDVVPTVSKRSHAVVTLSSSASSSSSSSSHSSVASPSVPSILSALSSPSHTHPSISSSSHTQPLHIPLVLSLSTGLVLSSSLTPKSPLTGGTKKTVTLTSLSSVALASSSSSPPSSTSAPLQFHPLFAPEVRQSRVPDGRWSIRNDPDALPIESEQMLEAAWHKMEKDAVVFTKKSLVCHFVFMRGHPPYQATSMLMDEKGVVRGAPRYVTRFSDHVMKGQYEFETVCSAGMLAMEMRPEKKYRPLTRQELAAFVRKQESAKSVAEEDVCAICQMSLVDLEETKPIAVSGSSGSSSTSSSSTSSSSSSNGRCGGGNVGVGGGAGGGGGGGENKSAKSAGKVKQEESDVDDDDDTEQDVINKTETKPENILVRSHNCHHVLHMECMKSLIESKSSTSTVCPECRTPYVSGVRFGSGPVGVLAVNHVGSSLPGFPNEGTIQMEVYFKSGIQGPRHPTPGAHYVAHGFPRSFYMPESQAALAFRLQLAFYWRIIFKIGTSQTTHEPDSVIWTGAVPVKSNFEPGQTRSFSDVPQENLDYFERLSRDLDAVGITAAFAELTHKHLRTPIV